MMRWLRIAGLALVLTLIVGLGLQAQQETSEGAESQAFYDTVDVRVVNVEVFVTDKKGNPITGLTREDFELYEDKKPVAITNFFAVEGGRPVAGAPAVAAPEPVVPGMTAEAPLLPITQQLHLVVYVDNFNLRPFNRNRVFRRLRVFLNENVGSQDKVMLVSYDRSLHVRQPFTSEPSLVNSALLELEKVSGHGIHADSEWRDAMRWIDEAEGISDAIGPLRTYAGSLHNDVSFTITALEDFVDTLAGLPGRKALVYVSDGVPIRPAEDLFYMISQKFGDSAVLTEALNYDVTRRFTALASKAATSRIVFYTIDAAGLRPYTFATAEQATASNAGLSSFVDTVRIQNLQDPLRMLAEQTGGRAILNTNDVGPDLDRVATDFETYYSLGYSPVRDGDGRLHDIKVRLKDQQKGIRIRHRLSYRDRSISTRMADGTKSALIHGYEQNPMGLSLEFGKATQREDGFYVVPIHVRIPLGKVVLVPQEEFFEARTKLFISALDLEGREAPVQELPLEIQIPSDRMQEAVKHYYDYEIPLVMREGDHQVAVGVRDELGASVSFVRRPIRVGS